MADLMDRIAFPSRTIFLNDLIRPSSGGIVLRSLKLMSRIMISSDSTLQIEDFDWQFGELVRFEI